MAGVSETGVSYENDELWYRRQTPIGSSVSIGIPACTIGIYRTDCGRYAACDGIWLSVKEAALLIQCALFITGIATIIQSFGIGKHIGARLPIVSGGSFTLITPMVVAANNPNIGIGGAFGAALVGSGVLFILGPIAIRYLHKYFSPYRYRGSGADRGYLYRRNGIRKL